MLKSFILLIARKFILFLDRLSPATRQKILYFTRRVIAIFLPDNLYLELERRAKVSLNRERRFGERLYRTEPKRKDIHYEPIVKPIPPLSKADIVVCCAFLGRERQLELAIHESQFSNKKIYWFLMGSDVEDEKIINRLSAAYGNIFGAVCNNKPIGAKWQACVNFLADVELDYDLLCISGSDDLIAAEGFDYVHGRYKHNLDYQKYSGLDKVPALYCTNGWYIYSKCPGSAYYGSVFKCHYNNEFISQPLGSGRFYTRGFLEKIKYFLFDCSLNKNLDNWGYENLLRSGSEAALFSLADVPIVSMKNELELNDFESIRKSQNVALFEIVFKERQEFFSKFKVDVKVFEI
jgi:hypothetical protein